MAEIVPDHRIWEREINLPSKQHGKIYESKIRSQAKMQCSPRVSWSLLTIIQQLCRACLVFKPDVIISFEVSQRLGKRCSNRPWILTNKHNSKHVPCSREGVKNADNNVQNHLPSTPLPQTGESSIYIHTQVLKLNQIKTIRGCTSKECSEVFHGCCTDGL